VKAWLQSKDDPFPKTHDLEALVNQAESADPDFRRFAKGAAVLTPYVSAFRYPGGSDEPMPSREEFDEALQHAQAIYDFVVNALPVAARP
jgi:HEPN domain-containing protein